MKTKLIIVLISLLFLGIISCQSETSICNDCERIRSISNLIVRFENKIDSVKKGLKTEFGNIESLTAIKESLEQNRLLLTKLCLEELGAKIHNEIMVGKGLQIIWKTDK